MAEPRIDYEDENEEEDDSELRCAIKRWLARFAGRSCNDQPRSSVHNRDNSLPVKPARILTRASCRVTCEQPMNQSNRPNASDPVQRRGSIATTTRVFRAA
jgi:hypothetical protein